MKFWGLNILTIVYVVLVLVLFPDLSLIVVPIGLLVHVIILLQGIFIIRRNFFFKSINNTAGKGALLTFDDSPNKHTLEILSVLKKHNVKAVFFVIGKYIDGNEGIINSIKADGHTIGNHSYSHDNFLPFRSSKFLLDDMKKCNSKLRELGIECKFYRPPFGVCNPRIARALNQTKLKSLGWNLRSFDTKAKTAESLLKKLKNRTSNNSVILLHDSQKITAEVLDRYLEYCRSQKINFVEFKVL